MAREVTLLPLPLSPTIPRVSPRATEKFKSRMIVTACLALPNRTVLAKDIQGQRRRAIRDERLGLIQALKRQHRQDGAENLLLHNGVLRRHAV